MIIIVCLKKMCMNFILNNNKFWDFSNFLTITTSLPFRPYDLCRSRDASNVSFCFWLSIGRSKVSAAGLRFASSTMTSSRSLSDQWGGRLACAALTETPAPNKATSKGGDHGTNSRLQSVNSIGSLSLKLPHRFSKTRSRGVRAEPASRCCSGSCVTEPANASSTPFTSTALFQP